MGIDLKTEEVLENIIEEGTKGEGGPEPGLNMPLPLPMGEAAASGGRRFEHLGTYAGTQLSESVIFAEEMRSINRRRAVSPKYKENLARVANFYKGLVKGRYSMQQLRENMMVDDFSVLLGDTLDRVLLAQYAKYQPSYRLFMRKRTVRDFRTVKGVRRSGGSRLSAVPESTTYNQDSVNESNYSYAVSKYGKLYKLTWEMTVNDDLDAFTSLPMEMAEDAIQTEMYQAASLYVANTTLFATNHSHNGNTYSNKGTAALSIAALEAAITAMLKYPGDNDMPLDNRPIKLVVGPGLWVRAAKMLSSVPLQWVGGGTNTAEPAFNVAASMLTLEMDPYIPVIDTTNGHTSWYLYSDPMRLPAVEYGLLRGHEQPQVFEKMPDARRMGGAGTAMDGAFADDTMGYKARHVFGGSHANATGGWRGAYWSDGTG